MGIEFLEFNVFGSILGENLCYIGKNIVWNYFVGIFGWIVNKLWFEFLMVDGCDDYIVSKKGIRKYFNWNIVNDVLDKYICLKINFLSVVGKNLLSYVYCCEGGNGDEVSEDGYKYRGYGIM